MKDGQPTKDQVIVAELDPVESLEGSWEEQEIGKQSQWQLELS